MDDIQSIATDGWWRQTARLTIAGRLLVAVLAGLAVMVGVAFLLREDAEYDRVYRQAARDLIDGKDFYAAGNDYVYPPLAAWLAISVARLDVGLARAIFLAINLIACTFLLAAAWRVAAGGRLLGAHTDRREHVAFWAGLFTAGFYLLNALNHTQTDIIIGAFVMAGCLSLVRGQSLIASIWFGLASAFKCTPLLWSIYFAWRGRFLAALFVPAIFVAVNLLPNLTADAPGGSWWLVHWKERYLTGVANPQAEVGAWHTQPRYNQSLSGAVQRLFFVDPGYHEGDLHETPRENTVDRQWVKFGVIALAAGLLLGCLLIIGRFRKPPIASVGPERRRDGLDHSVICILMLLLSPMSGKAHFGLLVLPGFCLARLAFIERSRTAAIALMLSVPLVLSGRVLTGWPGLFALWWGNVTWHAIVLLAGCLVAIRQWPAPSGDVAKVETPPSPAANAPWKSAA